MSNTCKECGAGLDDDNIDYEFCSRTCKEEYEDYRDSDMYDPYYGPDLDYTPESVKYLDESNGL